MNESKYLKLTLDNFIFNAGVAGLVRQLEFYDARYGEDGDYYFDGNVMYISKDFLLKTDLAKLYVDTAVAKYGEETVYNEILKSIDSLEHLTNQVLSLEAAGKKDEAVETREKLIGRYKYITDKLNRNSYQHAIDNLKDKGIETSISNLVNELKNTKDLIEKLRVSHLIKQEMKRPEVKEVLCFKDIIYSKIKMLWNNKAFLYRQSSNKDVFEVYNKDFVEPLISSLKSTKRSKTNKYCITCGCKTAKATSLSFMNDTVEDINKKKSDFWNQKPDAVLCPLCAYIYSLSPLGFNSYGNDMIFINNNDNVETLIKINESAKASLQVESGITEARNAKLMEYFNRIVEKEGEIAFNRISNIEVIVRSSDLNRYKLSVVGKDIIQVLRDCNKLFRSLINKSEELKSGEYVNVYQEVLTNLLDRRNQYMLLDKLLRARLSKDDKKSIYYLINILKIQIYSKGRERRIVNARMGMLKRAAKEGNDIRNLSKDNENALRGLSYQLLNSLKINNVRNFLDIISRFYIARSRPIPKEFLEAMKNEDDLLDTGYAFVLGLNGAAEGKQVDSDESNNHGTNNDENQNNDMEGWDVNND